MCRTFETPNCLRNRLIIVSDTAYVCLDIITKSRPVCLTQQCYQLFHMPQVADGRCRIIAVILRIFFSAKWHNDKTIWLQFQIDFCAM